MALQNTRAYMLRAEDLGQAGSLPKESGARSTVLATSRPTVQTGVLVGTLGISNMLGAAVAPADIMAGKVRVLVNRSTRYFISVTGQLAFGTTAGGTITVTMPIPPRGMLFLPTTFFGASAVISADTTWPLPSLTGAVQGALPPTAGSTSAVSFDFYAEP